MVPVQLNEVINRLNDMRDYSLELSKCMKDEPDLPEDAVPFIVEKLEFAFSECEHSDSEKKAAAFSELGFWLTRSWVYYARRLEMFGTPWIFRFGEMKGMTQH